MIAIYHGALQWLSNEEAMLGLCILITSLILRQAVLTSFLFAFTYHAACEMSSVFWLTAHPC